MSTIITPSEEQINIVVNDEKISINVESGDVIVNVTENIVEVSTVNGGYPLPTTVYSVFGRTGNIIAVDGDYDLGELGDVTLVSSTNGDVLTYDGTKWINKAVTGTGTVTSINMTVPVGLQVSGNPITVAGTLAVNFASGYSLPTTAKQTTWDAAYNDSIVSASVSGTTTKTLTLNQQDGGTITASWTDIDTNLVTSVNGYVGTVVLTTTDIAEGTRLYYTETRVSNNVDVAANTAARHSAVTIGTANGLSLASQVLSLALASASTTGALSSTDWVKFNTAYNDSIVSANVSGTTTKTLTLTQQDAGTITASWTDLAASGTVTSVAATVPAGLTISGSPIVSAGTLAFGLDTGYTIPLSTQLVPSGGTAGQLLTKNSATNYDTAWMDNYADWTEQLRDTVKAEVAINKGQAVYISGANGTNQLVSLASNTSEATSSKTLGLAMQNLAINGIGSIITEGLLGGLNTSTAVAGDPVWLGVSGNLIYGLTNKPVAPAHLVYIGVVTRVNSNNGEIYVKIQNGFELQELHNVLISSVANNEGLFYESATSLWKNKSIATVLGYTPISLTSLSGVSPLSYNNTTGAFSIAQATTSVNGYLSSTDWNTFNGKQAAFTVVNPLIYNPTTNELNINMASTTVSGWLSYTDYNTFNNKQTSGNYITALSGEATASGPGSAAVTLSTPAVTGKLLTGVNITGGSISATDSILVAFGKVQNQINGVLGGAIYQSVWNASTNSPTLTSGTGTKGYYYIVSVAGSTNLDGITDWKVGDWAIFNGTTWNKVDNTDAVSSVNGFTGAVSLTTANISESGSLYYTEGRVSANTDVAANTAARHSAVTIGTANGLSLSTQALSLALASTSATGALSSTDWNIFNLKQAALSGTGFVKISGSTISYDNSTYLTTSSAASTYLALSGGIMTGQIVLKESSSSTDYTKGLRFPNDPFGGGGDTSGLRLYASSGENIVLELYVGNDGGSDTINFATGVGGTANNDAVTINGNKIWNAANLTPQTQLNGTGFVKASGTTISYDNSTYYLASNPSSFITLTSLSVTGPLTYNNTTGAFNINKSSSTVSGWLSFDDWTTFNGKQNALNGTGFVKISGTTISYDNSTYLTTSAASSTYLPLAGGTLTGDLSIAYTTSNLRLFLNNTTTTTGRSWYFNSYSNGNLYMGNTTAGDIFNFSSTGAATFEGTTRVNGGISTIYSSSEARLNLNTAPDGESTTGWLYSNNDVTLGSSGIVNIQALTTTVLSVLDFRNIANNTATGTGGNVYIGTSVAQGINIGAGLSLGGWTTSTGGASAFARIVGRKENATSGNTAGYLSFETANASPNQTSEKMRITSTGNVGIGVVPTQSAALTFADSLGQKILLNNNANNYRIDLASSVSGGDAIMKFISGSTGAGEFGFYTTTNLRMLITSAGNVGIGDTTNASFKLSVTGTGGGVIANSSGAGDANFLSNSNTIGKHFLGLSGASTVFYVIQGGGVYSTSATITLITSDRNLKTDIVDYDKGLSEVLAMKPRYYKYKDNLQKQEIGFIAQEMDEALKGSMIDSIVKNKETNNNYKTYQLEWYPLLVNAIKEQQKQIEDLKQLINK